jgi:hypothetical protein
MRLAHAGNLFKAQQKAKEAHFDKAQHSSLCSEEKTNPQSRAFRLATNSDGEDESNAPPVQQAAFAAGLIDQQPFPAPSPSPAVPLLDLTGFCTSPKQH